MTRLIPNRDGRCDASDANWYFSTYFYVELFFLEFLRRQSLAFKSRIHSIRIHFSRADHFHLAFCEIFQRCVASYYVIQIFHVIPCDVFLIRYVLRENSMYCT